jgi:hypothetical protein
MLFNKVVISSKQYGLGSWYFAPLSTIFQLYPVSFIVGGNVSSHKVLQAQFLEIQYNKIIHSTALH